MKKVENILLLIGNAFNLIIFTFAVVRFLVSVSNFSEVTFKQYLYLFNEHLMPAAILLLLAVPSIILFVMNLKNKRSVVLPVITLVANTLLLCVLVFHHLPAEFQYIVLRELKIIDTSFVFLASLFISKYYIFIELSSLTIIAGSVLTLIRKKEPQNEA